MVRLSIEVTHSIAYPCLVGLTISISTQVVIAEIATERAVKRLVVVLTLVQARVWRDDRLFVTLVPFKLRAYEPSIE